MIYLTTEQKNVELKPMENLNSYTKSFETIIDEAKSGKISIDKINHYLYSLIEIYIVCEFLYEWFLKPTNKEKLELFDAWGQKDKLEKVTSIFNHHYNQSRFDSLSAEIKLKLKTDIEENIKDFSEKIYPNFKKSAKTRLSKKYDFAIFFLNMQLYRGISVCLRIGAISICTYNKSTIPNYIDEKFGIMDDNQMITRIVLDKYSFFFNSAQECLDDYIKLAKILPSEKNMNARFEEKLDEISSAQNKILSSQKEMSKENQKNFGELRQVFQSHEMENENESSIKDNKTYIAIVGIVPEFEMYFQAMYECGFWTYNAHTNIVVRSKEFSQYLLYEFLHDPNFKLYEKRNELIPYFSKLFKVSKKELNKDHSSDSVNYNNWKDGKKISEIFQNKLNEMENS